MKCLKSIFYCVIKKLPIWFVILSIVLELASCVYTPQLTVEQRLEPWKGRPVTSLFDSNKWGYPPDELNQEGDRLVYVYHRRASVEKIGGSGTAGTVGECSIKFFTKNEVIIEIRVEGDRSCLDSGESRLY